MCYVCMNKHLIKKYRKTITKVRYKSERMASWYRNSRWRVFVGGKVGGCDDGWMMADCGDLCLRNRCGSLPQHKCIAVILRAGIAAGQLLPMCR